MTLLDVRRPVHPTVRRLVLLAPALAVVTVFFVGGLAQTFLQSLGLVPFLPDQGPNLDAWAAVADSVAVRRGLWLTLRVAAVATLLATILGVGLALAVRHLARSRSAVQRLLESIVATPHLVGALAIGLLLAPAGLVSRLTHAVGLTDSPAEFPALTQDAFGWGVIAELVWKELPFIAIVALAALTPAVTDLERAAQVLGADRGTRIRRVTVPMVGPSILAASVLVFAFAMGTYEVPRLLGQPFPATLPVVAYQSFVDGDLSSRPEAMATAMLVAVLTLVVVAAYALVVRLTWRLR